MKDIFVEIVFWELIRACDTFFNLKIKALVIGSLDLRHCYQNQGKGV